MMLLLVKQRSKLNLSLSEICGIKKVNKYFNREMTPV